MPDSRTAVIEQIRRQVDEIHNPLRTETKVKGRYEEIFKRCLVNKRISVDYEPFSVFLGHSWRNGNPAIYTPDFILTMKIEGKQILMEPHWFKMDGNPEEFSNVFKRLSLFRHVVPNRYHIVLASNLRPSELRSRLAESPQNCFDEYWELERGTDRETRQGIDRKLNDLLARSIKSEQKALQPIAQDPILVQTAVPIRV